jgi:Major intrinsic protein
MALGVCRFGLMIPEIDLAKFLTALFTVGVAYGMGIVVALVVCTATSGGHFSPAVTIVHALFNGFPPAKAARLVKANGGLPNLCICEGISLPRFSVAFSLAGLCIGNGIHLSRSAYTSPLFSQRDIFNRICSPVRRTLKQRSEARVYTTLRISQALGLLVSLLFTPTPRRPSVKSS